MAAKKPAKPTQDMLRESAVKHARALMTAGGLGDVKARSIASSLNVSVGTIYNLFEDLDQLLFHLNADVYDDFIQFMDEQMAPLYADKTSTRRQKMMGLAHAYLKFVDANQMLWSGVMAFNRKPKKKVPDWYREKDRLMIGLVEKTIAGPPEENQRFDLELTAAALWATTHGIISVAVGRGGRVATPDEVFEQIDLVLSAIAERTDRLAQSE